jgi:cytochrome c oxidase subunit II
MTARIDSHRSRHHDRRVHVRGRRRIRCAAPAAAACALVVTGCGGSQSALNPQSTQARDISTMWWWMLGIATIVFLGAVGLLGVAWLRRHSEGLPLLGQREGVNLGMVVAFGILIPIVVLIGVFVVGNFVVMPQTDAPAASSTRLTIQVTGKQWFWIVKYPGTTAVTANEIHIPAGTKVNVVTQTADVIHSFWVPQLNRKIDMIPGRRNRVLLEADKPGRYRGQCAEFCGLQHAHMAMYVDVDTPMRFRQWLAAQAAPRRAPQTDAQRRGEQVFLSSQCASCHTIRGTSAQGAVGPDLTHVASRSTLAALTIPNTRGYLGGWILDPQHVKPGNRMPGLNLGGPDFQALLSYLESLK